MVGTALKKYSARSLWVGITHIPGCFSHAPESLWQAQRSVKSFDIKPRDNIDLKSWCPWRRKRKCYSLISLKTLCKWLYSVHEDILRNLILVSATALRSIHSVKKTCHRKSFNIRVEVCSWHLFLIHVYFISLQILVHLFQMNMEHFICWSSALMWSI